MSTQNTQLRTIRALKNPDAEAHVKYAQKGNIMKFMRCFEVWNMFLYSRMLTNKEVKTSGVLRINIEKSMLRKSSVSFRL